ncbi:hypothetical protein PR048_013318 [Dryococelus australis]|uniref:Uncharacterized protein n=1 Tax=Dryococelus australis TaxID=614101 RepID=A0ABQ9HRT6_9NEOP|nr:hypothetical protein PR048_013318 [Dryococelus australis]
MVFIQDADMSTANPTKIVRMHCFFNLAVCLWIKSSILQNVASITQRISVATYEQNTHLSGLTVLHLIAWR